MSNFFLLLFVANVVIPRRLSRRSETFSMDLRASGDSGNQDGGRGSGLLAAQDDDDDEVLNNTLYELTDLQEYTARKVEADDIRAIRNLLKDEDYCQFRFEDPLLLYETCCFSLAISDIIETDRLVAAAFFDDTPAFPDLMKNSKKWKPSHDLRGMSPINTYHMRCFICSPEVAEDVCLTEIISHTFSSSIHIDYIVVEMPDLENAGPYAFSPLVKEVVINTVGKQKRKLIIYQKELLMPHLIVREGREHDLDDLLPLLPMDTQVMEQHFGKSNLSDIIAMAEKGNQSMIAEWKLEAVGIISVSADIDYEMMNNFYHLEPFHGLRKPHRNDEIYINEEAPKAKVEIDFDKLFKQAEHTFRDRRVARQNEATQPYDIEVIKEFSMCSIGGSEEGTSTALDKAFTEKAQGPHQFTVRVSDDIMLYGLKPKGPLEPEDFGCGDRTSASKSDLPSDQVPDNGGEETRISETLPRGRLSSLTSQQHGDLEGKMSMSRLSQVGSNIRTASKLAVVVEESNEEEEESIDVVEEKPKVEFVEVEGDDVGTAVEGEDNEEQEQASTSVTGEREEEGEMKESQDIPKLVSGGETTGEEDEEEEETAEDIPQGTPLSPVEEEEAEVTRTEDEAPSPPPAEIAAADAGADAGEQTISAVNVPASYEPSRRPSAADSLASAIDSDEGFEVDKPNNETVAEPEPEEKTDVTEEITEDPTQLTQRNREILERLPSEVRRRLSDDTLLPGGPHPSRTLNDKVEIFKKIWDVYHLIQDNGISLEHAKGFISRADMTVLQEAELFSTDRLLQYIVALFPDGGPQTSMDEPVEEVKKSVFRGIANALAVKLFNMGKKYMPRNMDLFRDIFRAFPNREYLMVTVPIGGSIKQPSWLENFVRVIPKADTSYPRDLFLLHKVVITSKVRVRRARDKDVVPVRNFLSSLIEKEKIFQDFLRSFEKDSTASNFPKMTSYVMEVKNYEGTPIIGLVVVSPELEAVKYLVKYDLERHTYFGAHEETSAHGYVHHLIINPIFQRHGKLLLKEVMRQDEKECLFHRVYPDNAKSESVAHQSILNNMEDWIPLMPRKRIHYDDLNMNKNYDDERQPPLFAQQMDQPYAVIHTAKRFIMEPKINLTKRIVFVGASTTTISCLEKLISSTYRSFKYLTLIDPYGLPGSLPEDPVRNEFFAIRNGGTKMSYATDSEWIQRAGIHLWVQVVIGRVTKIDRESKNVIVNADCVVPYDKLVLAPGLQFQRLDCPKAEINDPNFMAFKKNTATHDLQQSNHLNFNRDVPKPKNAFMINNEVEAHTALKYIRKFRQFMEAKKVLIFGRGLQTFACVKALLACGIPASSIVLIGTPEKEIEWEKKSGYTLSSKVRGPMERELHNLGVNLVTNYEFDHWETCPVSGLVKRIHFKSLTERHAQISFATFAIFSYRYRRVDDGIVSALSEAYILYQNGIVIDVSFKTNDPNIYAAGPATTYQKILLADHQNHIYYQSEEIGHKLAEFLIDSSGSEGGGQGKLEDFNVIQFKRPLIRALKLLGGWHYLYLRSPGSHSRCSDLPGSSCEESCECTTEVVTGSVHAEEDPRQKFFKIRLDDRSRIVSLECMSKMPFSFSNLSALYGKHEVLLNKLMERMEIGETTCLYSHFRQSWFAVFCIDEWDHFADELKDLYREHDIGDGTKMIQFIHDFIANLDNPEALQMDPNIIRSVWRSSKLKNIVEDKLLNFIKFHRASLPMFAQNNYVEDLLEERSASALYYPNTKSHMTA